MKWDERDDANAAYLNVLTGVMSRREAIARFNLDRMIRGGDPFERNATKGSQNYDITARAVMDDATWFMRLYEGYKVHGLHSKEFGPVYLKHHLMAWGMMAASGMPEAYEVLRATWTILTLMSWPSVPEHFVSDSGLGTAVGPMRLEYHGPYVLPVGERTNEGSFRGNGSGPFTENSLFLALALDLPRALKVPYSGTVRNPALQGNWRKPFPVSRPTWDGMVELTNGKLVMIENLKMGPWSLRVMDHPDRFNFGLNETERSAIFELYWDGNRYALQYISFPYAGELIGYYARDRVSVASTQQLNGNKPPIEAATVSNDLSLATSVVQVVRSGPFKRTGARGAEAVYAMENDICVKRDGIITFVPIDKSGINWIWNRAGFQSNLPIVPEEEEEEEVVVYDNRKTSFFGKVWKWLKNLF